MSEKALPSEKKSGTAKSLKRYRAKRSFSRTPEPRGGVARKPDRRKAAGIFVVQEHHASRLHYDFRLELNGVLLSWAVPKGPSLSPRDKRLAVRVEDHPLEYADFEGVIPEGQYGAGKVFLWDRGRWVPDGDPIEGLRKGELKFRLEGRRLKGAFTLVRMNGKAAREDEQNWLLIKRKEESAKDPADVEIAGVRLTHSDRVLYPEQGVTKRELARYYEAVAEWILPHVSHRPLTLVRCPEGPHKGCFYQKHAIEGVSEAVTRVRIREKNGTATYLSVDSLAGIVSLVQFGVLELHTWGSQIDDLERPDRMVFDLDPGPGVSWSQVVATALRLRKAIEALGLSPFVNTTGGKGLHVTVPILPRSEWEEVKAFAKTVSDELAREAPQRLTTQMAKVRRRGKIFIDYLRNTRGASAVAPYSPRARPGAPVATPIAWNELEAGVRAEGFDVRTVPVRLSQLRVDPWKGYERSARSLAAVLRKLGGQDEEV
jgi:bifunctional non-homologous end joining protein LigD